MSGGVQTCPVNVAIRDALRDAAEAYERQGILVIDRLEATAAESASGPALRQALYTIFRGLPHRLAPGATLYVSTSDAPAGGVELTWEARERADAPVDADARGALRSGPHGDLLELALLGLESICGVRAEQAGSRETLARGLSGLDLSPRIQRRYAFLIPATPRPAARAGAATSP